MVMIPFEQRKYGLVAKPSYDQILKYIEVAANKKPDTFIDRAAKRIRETPQISNLLDGEGFGHKDAEKVFNNNMEHQELQRRLVQEAQETNATLKNLIAGAKKGSHQTPQMFDMTLDDTQEDMETDINEAVQESRKRQGEKLEGVAQRMATSLASSSSQILHPHTHQMASAAAAAVPEPQPLITPLSDYQFTNLQVQPEMLPMDTSTSSKRAAEQVKDPLAPETAVEPKRRGRPRKTSQSVPPPAQVVQSPISPETQIEIIRRARSRSKDRGKSTAVEDVQMASSSKREASAKIEDRPSAKSKSMPSPAGAPKSFTPALPAATYPETSASSPSAAPAPAEHGVKRNNWLVVE